MKILSVFGTRPEAIKMAPVVLTLANDPRFESRICVTGQHSEMLEQVNSLFGLQPDVDLKIMKAGQGLTHITTAVLAGMEAVLHRQRPDWVLVHGDTTTSTAAALAAFYAGIPVGHVEAGLRTRNLLSPWPEEANRQITGRLTSLHFAPTPLSKQNLIDEMISEDRIVVTGNTVIDALHMVKNRLDGDRQLPLEAGGVTAWSTLTFSSRTASALNEIGGSIATSVSSWNMWFCTMSRSAPASS